MISFITAFIVILAGSLFAILIYASMQEDDDDLDEDRFSDYESPSERDEEGEIAGIANPGVGTATTMYSVGNETPESATEVPPEFGDLTFEPVDDDEEIVGVATYDDEDTLKPNDDVTEIDGIGEHYGMLLCEAGYCMVGDLRMASDEALLEIDGIGEGTVETIREAFDGADTVV